MRWTELPGAGPVRVYVAGLGSMTGPYFADAALHPALAGRRSLLVDLLGHGLSDRPHDFGYTLAEQADALATTLRAAQVRDAEVVGHSLGGSVVILLASRDPELHSGLPVIRVPRAGHNVMLDNPDGFAAAVASALRGDPAVPLRP